MTTSQSTVEKGSHGLDEIVTTTKTTTTFDSQRGQKRTTTKVTKTKKSQIPKDDHLGGEDSPKEGLSITELSDEDLTPEPGIQKSSATAPHKTRVCFLFLYCLNTNIYFSNVLSLNTCPHFTVQLHIIIQTTKDI